MASHGNIVELIEAFRKKGIVYLVFEYVENNMLEVLEKSQAGLKINLIRKLIFQLLHLLERTSHANHLIGLRSFSK